jgi:hypothetical protein
MHELVTRITDAELCYVFARNARNRGRNDLALQALRRAADLKAESHKARSEAELAALRAIYAYEEALSHIKGKRTRATGTWQLVNKHGVLAALAKRLASRDKDDVTAALKELGMEDYSFEAVYRQHSDAFNQEAA